MECNMFLVEFLFLVECSALTIPTYYCAKMFAQLNKSKQRSNKQNQIQKHSFSVLAAAQPEGHRGDSHHVTLRDEEVVTWTGRGEPTLWPQHTTCR